MNPSQKAVGFFLLLAIACTPPEVEDPCAAVECLNGGECLYGYCRCEEGFLGDSCQFVDPPSGFGLDQIIINDYPTFDGDDPWDIGLSAPECWPDLIVELSWPWLVTNATPVLANQSGQNLIIDDSMMPGLEEWHIHDATDTILLELWEVDGIDSLESIAPPELIFSANIVPAALLPLDSGNLPSFSVTSDSQGTQARITWRFDYDH